MELVADVAFSDHGPADASADNPMQNDRQGTSQPQHLIPRNALTPIVACDNQRNKNKFGVILFDFSLWP